MAYVALGSYVALGAAASAPRTIRKGSKGEEVRQAQRLLNAWAAKNNVGFTITVDGDFGNETYEATMQYQRANRDADGKQLKVDGVIGPRTWSALLGLSRVPQTASGGASSSTKTPPAAAGPVVDAGGAGPGPQASVKGGGLPLWMIAGVAGGLAWVFWPQISGKKKS